MNIEKRNWCFHAAFLVFPFIIESFTYPLFGRIQPQWLSVMLFFICYTYVFYGLAIFIHSKWRKKIGEPVAWSFRKLNWSHVLLALIAGIVFRRIEYFAFSMPQTPMLLREAAGYIKNAPTLWMGIGGYALQFIYYMFEFTLVACIVDCAQKACKKLGWSNRIPWGGLFLGITWGLMHIVSQDLLTGIACFLLSVVIGSVYAGLTKKTAYAWICVFAAYLL